MTQTLSPVERKHTVSLLDLDFIANPGRIPGVKLMLHFLTKELSWSTKYLLASRIPAEQKCGIY